MRRAVVVASPVLLALASAAGCGGSAEHPPGAASGAGASGAAAAAAGGGATGPTGSSSSGGSAVSSASSGGAASGTGGGPPCASDANDDLDGDGFTPNGGDCDDCDPGVNPAAFDFVGVDDEGNPLPEQLDEDCDGSITQPGEDVSCDALAPLPVDDGDPVHAANAIDICQQSDGTSWGIVGAAYVQLDGTPLPDAIGHGILAAFGTQVVPQRGVRMLGLSSGTARQPSDPGYQPVAGHDKSYGCPYPPQFPLDSPACVEVESGPPRDSAALQLDLKVPSNVDGFAFRFDFHTAEYPQQICTASNDLFVTLMQPPPLGAFAGNLVYDMNGDPVSVNFTAFPVCTPGMHGGKSFACPLGTGDLAGTGFEAGAATGWLQTAAPAEAGSVITLTFAVADADNGLRDSTVLVDDFRWLTPPLPLRDPELPEPF
jgi:hypothetical protein